MIVYHVEREPSPDLIQVFPGETPAEAGARAQVDRLRAELEVLRHQFSRLRAATLKAHKALEVASQVPAGFEVTRQRVIIRQLSQRLDREADLRMSADNALDDAIAAVHDASSLGEARDGVDRALVRAGTTARAA